MKTNKYSYFWSKSIINVNMEEQELITNSRTSSFITVNKPNKCLRILSRIDLFCFLPVPRDDPISTKQSIIGSIVFLALFLTYIIIDFVQFVQRNSPVQQTFFEPLDQQSYTLPDFALAFMTSNQGQTINNYTQIYDNLFSYQWNLLTKSAGKQNSQNISNELVTYLDNNQTNFDKLNWMDDQNKQFYYILRTPTLKNITSKGLLYSSPETTYLQVKASFCKNDTINSTKNICLPLTDIAQLSNYGRFFLFIENQVDNSTVSMQNSFPKNNHFLLYNFFVIPGIYKRITIKFAVTRTEILPDYFFRFKTENNVRMEVDSITEQISVVNSINVTNTDAISFNFQLAPEIVHNRVSYKTIIDHISMWGAFFGVLFGVFAIIFLARNRKKFYQKNPDWNHFKQVVNQKKTFASKLL